mgnify:CR=1 FL=1
MHLLKSESDDLRGQVEGLMNQLIERDEDVLKEIHPDLLNDYKSLKETIKDQKDENESLYKQLLVLKKQTATAQ